MLLCSLQGKIVPDQRPIVCEVNSCTIKRVPALLQTTDGSSFYTPYSVNETSSLLLCLCPGVLVAETKLQDKFASVRQVNSSSSQDTFQICFTDMYLVEFLANFAVFHVFLSISRDFADIREFCIRFFYGPRMSSTRYGHVILGTTAVWPPLLFLCMHDF